jgi:hypothetical protein
MRNSKPEIRLHGSRHTAKYRLQSETRQLSDKLIFHFSFFIVHSAACGGFAPPPPARMNN